jgi:hypothetical protein
MVKAIALTFQWRRLQESGPHATVDESAAAEKINESYVGRVLRLSLLAPDIVEGALASLEHLRTRIRNKPIAIWHLDQREHLRIEHHRFVNDLGFGQDVG